jgi:hypothetical protein
VLISGSEAGLNWIEAQPNFAALVVLDDGRALLSACMNAYLWR